MKCRFTKGAGLKYTWFRLNVGNLYILKLKLALGLKVLHLTYKVWVTPSTKLRDLLITWARDKCRALYLPFHNTYDHQTWQSSYLRWENPTFKITWPFDYMVTWQMKKTYIFTSTISMATKLGRVVTCSWKIPSTKSYDLLITRSRDKWKILQLSFHNT